MYRVWNKRWDVLDLAGLISFIVTSMGLYFVLNRVDNIEMVLLLSSACTEPGPLLLFVWLHW